MYDGHQRLGAADYERFQIDLWLVPKFEPIARERLGQLDGRSFGGLLLRWRSLQLCLGEQALPEFFQPKRLFERRQHRKPVRRTDLLDVEKHGYIASADEQ